MTKNYLILIFCIVCFVQAKSQSIDPVETTEVCPGQEYTFSVTLPGKSPSVTPWAINIIPYVTQGAYNIVTNQSGTSTTFNFKGKFEDDNNNQTFRVSYTNSSSQNAIKDFTFIKTKSLLRASTLSAISPTPANIQVARCQVQSFNISFPNIPYSNIFANPGISYGTVTTYEYLLPPGWMLGTTTSNGSDWIAGNNNVTVTSDLSNGVNGNIFIRAVNTCNETLIKGDAFSIPISRPAPSMVVTGPEDICSSANYNISLPSGATVVWSISNTAIATIPSNSTSSTVTVTKVGDMAIVTLTATVTHCTFTYTLTKNIQIGKPQTPTVQAPVYYGNEVGLTALFIPGASYNWYENNVLTEQGGTNTYVAFVPCNSSKTISVEAVNSCGTSIKARRGVSVSCSGTFTVSPNPAQGDFTVQVSEENQASKEIKEVNIIDRKGQLRKKQKYVDGTKNVTLNTSGLEADIYVLQIFDGTAWYKQKMIVK